VPRRIEIVDTIPKTLIGKPLRRVVREVEERQAEERQAGGGDDPID